MYSSTASSVIPLINNKNSFIHNIIYYWNEFKNFSKANKLFCTSVIFVFAGTIALIVTLTLREIYLIGPDDWYITRSMWSSARVENPLTTEAFEPLRLVVIHHTTTVECHDFLRCASEMRRMQSFYLRNFGYDIPYNFVVGNEGRIYEGRGYGIVGAHTFGYNSCTIGIGFVGDYRDTMANLAVVTPLQVENVHRLLDEAVRSGLLHPDYHVVGARDIRSTISPGEILQDEIQTWPHYDHNELYVDKTCQEIQEMFQDSSGT